MDGPPKVKKRRMSTKHSQTGCRTCKKRHIKCDERRPRCNNCEKANRDCEFDPSPQRSVTPSRPSPIQPPAPSPTALSSSNIMYFDPSFDFQSHTTEATGLPLQSAQHLPFPYSTDIYSATHSVDLLPGGFIQSQATGTATPISTSIRSSPRLPHPANANSIVRNAAFVNDVQSHSALGVAVRAFSRDYRLPGLGFTIETVLSPMIFRSSALRHAIFANYLFQTDQAPLTSPTPVPDSLRDPSTSEHSQHYQTAMTHLNATLNNPEYDEVNLAAHLILGFYCLVKGDLDYWKFHSQSVTDQIRARGQTIRSHPPSLPAKLLFHLHVRTDTVASNSVCLSATTDPETIRIAYSGVPISDRSILPARLELELLLAEISAFQYDCSTVLSLGGSGWQSSPQIEAMRVRYRHLLEKLGKWQGLTANAIVFEEAEMGEYIQGSVLPPEMGSPLLCHDQGFAQLWVLHCTASIHVHCIAARHHLIPRIPDEVQATAALCCRIISGRSMIDPFEPSPALIWPLVNMSYILSFRTGKIWAADQLDSVARRYLPNSARRIANTIRENLNPSAESTKILGAMVPPLPTPVPPTAEMPDQAKLVAAQFITSSQAPIAGGTHYFYAGSSTSTMDVQSQRKVEEHDVYQHGPPRWDEM